MNAKYLEWAWKILSVLVIPLIGWGMKLEVNNALQDARINQLEKDLSAVVAIRAEVQATAVTIGRLEEKLNAANRNLDDIRLLLHPTGH